MEISESSIGTLNMSIIYNKALVYNRNWIAELLIKKSNYIELVYRLNYKDV